MTTDFEVELNLAFARGDHQRVGWLLSVLSTALQGAASTGRGKVSAVRHQAQQTIKALEPPKLSEPRRAIIEGMPQRETISSVERDQGGNIIRARQTEMDAISA